MSEEALPVQPPVQPVPEPAPVLTPETSPVVPSGKSKSKTGLIIALGVLVVLIIGISTVFIIKSGGKSASVPTPTPPVQVIKPTIQPFDLTLSSPAEDSLITEDLIIVKGKTSANTSVVFYTETSENSVDSDSAGNFEGTLKLIPGINTLIVAAFGENGEEKTLAYNIVYNDQVKAAKAPPGQEKKNENTAIIGTFEQANSTSVVVKNKTNKSVESQIDKNVKSINQNKKSVDLKTLKKADLLAIIASDSGKTNQGQINKALKIYILEASASAQIKRKAIMGVISDITGNTITLTHQIQTQRTFKLLFDNQTKVDIKNVAVATTADLKIGMRISAVGNLDAKGQLTAKRIHVIPGKATGVISKYPTPATGSGNLTPTLTGTPSATPTTTVTATPTPTIVVATPTLTPTPLPTASPTLIP